MINTYINHVHTLFLKEPLYKEPTCGKPKYPKNLNTSKGKFSQEFFNLKHFYNSKQSRIRKQAPLICSQTPHRLIAMLVLSPSFFIDLMLQTKVKAIFRASMYTCVCTIYRKFGARS